MRDRLTPPHRLRPGAPPPPVRLGGDFANRTGTQSLGFQQQTTRGFTAPSQTLGGMFIYGPFTIFSVPKAVNRAEIRKLAVAGDPEGNFLNRMWWQVLKGGGPAQEFQLQSRTTADAALVDPATVAGIRNAPFGSLERPRDVQIELAQAVELQLQVMSSAIADPLTVHVFLGGIIEYRTTEGE